MEYVNGVPMITNPVLALLLITLVPAAIFIVALKVGFWYVRRTQKVKTRNYIKNRETEVYMLLQEGRDADALRIHQQTRRVKRRFERTYGEQATPEPKIPQF